MESSRVSKVSIISKDFTWGSISDKDRREEMNIGVRSSDVGFIAI